MNEHKYRVVAYIDGFNLYYGIKSKGWQHLLWLNLCKLISNLLRNDQDLIKVKYFTTRVSSPPEKVHRQSLYIDALQTLDNLQIFYGQYVQKDIACRTCSAINTIAEEKRTDVNIAVELLVDAYKDVYDTALLISADSDLFAAVDSIRQLFPHKRLIAAFPPGRQSIVLKNTAHHSIFIGKSNLAKSQFPDEVVRQDGYVLRRPKVWHTPFES